MNENRYFQWVAGDQRGQILVFDKIEPDGADVYITFKDQSRINENLVAQLNQADLTGKLMAEIDNPKNGWSFKDEYVGREEEKWEKDADGINRCVVPFNPGRKVTKLIPPRPTPKTTSNFGAITAQPVQQPSVPVEQPKSSIDTSDPVYIMMAKSKKVDNDVEMTLTVSMPPKSLYNVANESFDDGGKKVVEYIIENIDIKDIKEALKIAITEMYATENQKSDTQKIGPVLG